MAVTATNMDLRGRVIHHWQADIQGYPYMCGPLNLEVKHISSILVNITYIAMAVAATMCGLQGWVIHHRIEENLRFSLVYVSLP